ncbi:MAG TPA: endonuclease/exonuclease/phosphatase family protein [Rhodocyclaceae bacterium]|nr:endonuclease/exonuclease/phosphatase family protein [Rhodocyclaceae bacterium]HMV55248.1 endonuclease/exonuclease/phosphatase family protein [Rhodocyclaceae bacterium]HNB77796.1 endonuclease/exonuclease/phosphatase family protein [Rhodocyclaceae bacterium]HNC62945.1 endonuclease/exonuclease/phosphatase family protein [Rhodocyclaceae bacterium]
MQLITWNIQWGRGCDGRVDLARIARVLRETGDADVVCLQEVAVNFAELAGSSGEDQVALLSLAFPGYAALFGAGTDLPDAQGERRRFGNLVLSRLPVLQVWRHPLPWPPDPAVPSMQRTCVEAVVMSRGGPLRVMTTHLEYYSALQRAAQVEALRDLHRQACAHARRPRADKSGSASDAPFAVYPRPDSAILCGDFNYPPEAAEHGRLQAPIDDTTPAWRDAWPLAHPGEPHAHTVGLHGADWPDHPYCCDFVCVSADLAPRVRDVRVNRQTDASDHQPVLLELLDA